MEMIRIYIERWSMSSDLMNSRWRQYYC